MDPLYSKQILKLWLQLFVKQAVKNILSKRLQLCKLLLTDHLFSFSVIENG